MILFRWLVAIPLFALWTYIAALNWYNIAGGFFGRRVSSPILLFGGVAGMIGVMLMPVEGALNWIWVPLVLDYGSAPFLALTFAACGWWGLRRVWRLLRRLT